MLPLQRYHARKRGSSSFNKKRGEDDDIAAGGGGRRNSRRRRQTCTSSIEASKSLQSIWENQSQFNLSKSSTHRLEQYIFGLNNNSSSINDEDKNISSNKGPAELMTTLPAAVMTRKGQQEERSLLAKIRIEHYAAQPIPKEEVLEILYCDAHICVVNKPSGILSVPGPRRNPSLANLIYDTIQPPSIDLDQTVVHRLDMDTSGIMVYALSVEALSKLHSSFKQRNVQKTYEALVDGHLLLDNPWSCCCWEGEIDVALERDPNNPPFMRIAQSRNIIEDEDDAKDNYASSLSRGAFENSISVVDSSPPRNHKLWRQAPKPSQTTWTILSREYRNNKPVTRLELRPWTGRTHQLRVHTSQVLGAAIVGDDIYGRRCNDPTTRRTRMEDGVDALPLDDGGNDDDQLCLHAKRLCIFHPISGAAMIFEADPPF